MCINTPKYLFLPDFYFKICEKPSKFSKRVRVIIDVSTLSLTSLTPCPFSQLLRPIFENIKFHFCYFLRWFFNFFQSKIKTTRTHIFLKYLWKNEIVRETVFACSYGAQVEYLTQHKKMVKNLVTLSLFNVCFFSFLCVFSFILNVFCFSIFLLLVLNC